MTCEQGRAKTWISPLRCGTTGILQVSLQAQIQGVSSYSDRRVLEPYTETGRKGSVKGEKQCTLTSQGDKRLSGHRGCLYCCPPQQGFIAFQRKTERPKRSSYTGGNVAYITGRKSVKNLRRKPSFLIFTYFSKQDLWTSGVSTTYKLIKNTESQVILHTY